MSEPILHVAKAPQATQDRLPTGKIERASKFLQTGLKVGANYAGYYAKKAVGGTVSRDELDRTNAEDMFASFTELRGSALKVAQMLSLDTVNLSASFTNVMAKAQYSVPPMSAPMALQVFTKSIGSDPLAVFDSFEPIAVKAASMGQVHRAVYKGRPVAVKIQYPGVADSITSDLAMVKRFAPAVVKASAEEMEPYFEEVTEKLLEEANYRLELKNSMEFREACAHLDGIVFPEYFPEVSSDRVLTMSWLEGMHLREFMATAAPETITLAAQRIWDFYDYQTHVLHRINADPHPGNFLFFADGRVGVLDFGCTKQMTEETYEDYFRLANPTLLLDREGTLAAFAKLGILRPSDSPENVEFLLDVFVQLIRLVTRPLHQGSFYFNDPAFYQEVADIGMRIAEKRELRGNREFLFINRMFLGLFTLMQQMDATLRTTSPNLVYSV
jgi:predicted unusual protein kinase regulating ubiquinone biosynthesis (AarF/ABC1/UbiB family)